MSVIFLYYILYWLYFGIHLDKILFSYLKKLDLDNALLMMKNNETAQISTNPTFNANQTAEKRIPISFSISNPPIIANTIEKIVLTIIVFNIV